MPVTNKDILAKLEENATTLAVMNERLKVVDEHHKTLYGNGQPGLVKDVDRINTTGKVALSLLSIAVTVLTAMQALTGCAPVSPPQATAAAHNATYAAGTATAVAVFVPTPEYDPSQTPTASATPEIVVRATPTATASPTSSVITVTPHPSTTPVDHIIEVDTQEVEWLAALCWVEVRNFGDKRPGACASVIDTVMTRIRKHKMSGGDVFSTITYGCNEDSATCQFPSWAVRGCQGIIPQACPFYDDEGMIYFRGVVLGYLDETIKPICPNFLYYGSRVTDRGECEIVAPDGAVEAWHN